MPAISADSVLVHVRVPVDVVGRIDAIAENHGGGFGRLGRSEIIRKLIVDGLAVNAPAARPAPAARTRVR